MHNCAQNPANSSQPTPLQTEFSRLEGLLKVLNASALLCQSSVVHSPDDISRLQRYCRYLAEDCAQLLEAARQFQAAIEGDAP